MRKHHYHHINSIHRYSRIYRRDLRRAGVVIGVFVLLVIVAVFLIQHWENKTYATSAKGVKGVESSALLDDLQLPDITYHGVIYESKPLIEAYLVMGIDVSGPVVSVPGAYNGGQADALFLMVVDNESETWRILRLNRDSMVEVPVLDLRGDIVGYQYQQLALAHAYGDGTRNSCENTVNAVSIMLGGCPIDGYASLNMDGVVILNDAVGGVTLTVSSDFTAIDPTLIEGETITLNGQQAMEYVRSRMSVDDQSNLARMERQRQYLEAVKPQLLTLNDEEILRTYDALSDYIVTNLGSQEILDLAEKIAVYEELPALTIEGTNAVNDGHMTYTLNEDSLQQVILELFYREK